jgi:hypothetical protein
VGGNGGFVGHGFLSRFYVMARLDRAISLNGRMATAAKNAVIPDLIWNPLNGAHALASEAANRFRVKPGMTIL